MVNAVPAFPRPRGGLARKNQIITFLRGGEVPIFVFDALQGRVIEEYRVPPVLVRPLPRLLRPFLFFFLETVSPFPCAGAWAMGMGNKYYENTLREAF